MTQPGPGWLVDAFLYRCGAEKGCLFLAWKGSETSVMYTNADTRQSTPWHGRWYAAPEQSKVFGDLVRVKEQWTREVYVDTVGKRRILLPTYISLGELTDLFVGIDPKGRAVSLFPLTAIGEGLEYTSEELAKIRMTMKRRCAWTVLERMLPRFSVYQLRLPRARM